MLLINTRKLERFDCETENVVNFSTGSEYIFATYMIDAVSKVHQYDYDGQLVREIELPGIGSAGGFGGKMMTQNSTSHLPIIALLALFTI